MKNIKHIIFTMILTTIQLGATTLYSHDSICGFNGGLAMMALIGANWMFVTKKDK